MMILSPNMRKERKVPVLKYLLTISYMEKTVDIVPINVVLSSTRIKR